MAVAKEENALSMSSEFGQHIAWGRVFPASLLEHFQQGAGLEARLFPFGFGLRQCGDGPPTCALHLRCSRSARTVRMTTLR